ncbi:MAG: four helix bundle protein [Patescibacteria group bacterium]
MSDYDLEERTLQFAKRIIILCKSLPHNTINQEIVRQLVRSTGSIGANYREANDALGQKDFIFRLRISRKEVKESHYWLELLLEANHDRTNDIKIEIQEAYELKRIFSVIIYKLENKHK